jgi:hypothetical protein
MKELRIFSTVNGETGTQSKLCEKHMKAKINRIDGLCKASTSSLAKLTPPTVPRGVREIRSPQVFVNPAR